MSRECRVPSRLTTHDSRLNSALSTQQLVSEADRAAVRARLAPGHVGTVRQSPDDLALAESAALVRHYKLVAARREAMQHRRRGRLLDRHLFAAHPLPARR